MANQAHHKITQITNVGLGHGMVRSLQNYVSPLITVDVPDKRYYIEKLQILM